MTSTTPLKLNLATCRYRAMIGVGGIGTGMFFRLNDNGTLGREESRSGVLLDRRDYCKLHIIAHYVRALLGPEFAVIPVGKVGADDAGRILLGEMEEAGLVMRCVEQVQNSRTLFSICFTYPDGAGGNLTTSDSACSQVDRAFVAAVEPEFRAYAGKGIALAAPEVTIDTRVALLELATTHRFYRVASFTSEEMGAVTRDRLLRHVDLLAVNLEEAAAAAGMKADAHDPLEIVKSAVAAATGQNPSICLSVTRGKEGSWVWDGTSLTHLSAIDVPVESTAGAGDAFTAGLIAGLTAGLTVPQSQQMATLAGAVSITSPHTINKGLSRETLWKLCSAKRVAVDPQVSALLKE
ncbi:MAG: bifunctional hydroxymethylpyrimidine kinase/phosphomethylpyrimidine kinase [Bacteroidetes bacterium]|nr:bifunctional hydroxymethylpyrimidine kinase/phosphomethylpyrimidine kinase [Bacteroidota bacterium]